MLVFEDQPTNLKIENNQIKGAGLEKGFIKLRADLVKSDGIWQLKTNLKRPFWLETNVGPSWKSKN